MTEEKKDIEKSVEATVEDMKRKIDEITAKADEIEDNDLKKQAKEIAQKAVDVLSKAGDKLMTEIFERWESDITDGIIGLANLFDPDCVVLSGSMAEYVSTEKIENRVNSEIVTAPTKIKKAAAGNYAGMIGAALLAMEVWRG